METDGLGAKDTPVRKPRKASHMLHNGVTHISMPRTPCSPLTVRDTPARRSYERTRGSSHNWQTSWSTDAGWLRPHQVMGCAILPEKALVHGRAV